ADPVTLLPDNIVPEEPTIARLSGSCFQGQFLQFDASQWSCDSTIEFYSASGPLALGAETAVATWQSRLTQTALTGLPFFTTTIIPGDAEATVIGSAAGSTFCGRWFPNTKQLEVLSAAQCAA